MRRRERPIDPELAAELAALDAALTGERHDPAIALIAEEARAWAPPMTPAFAAQLDNAVAAGFPRSAAPAKQRSPLFWRLAPVAGVAAAVLVALVVVLGGNGKNEDALQPSVA